MAAAGGHGPALGRIGRQLDFLLAADRLKQVTRHNRLLDGSRNENSAEHSWHLALMALTLAEHAKPGTDVAHVVEMLVVHDLVEIDAGDHWILGDEDPEIARREAQAAERLYAMLPDDQRARFHDLWLEFEERRTEEARFARALDSLHPLTLVWGPGGSGLHRPLTASFMLEHKRPALEPYPGLWELARTLLAEAVARGTLPP